MAAETSGTSCSSSAIAVELEESDIDGATLEEPLETHTVPKLRWWLVCHGQDDVRSSERKAELIARRVHLLALFIIVINMPYIFHYQGAESEG